MKKYTIEIVKITKKANTQALNIGEGDKPLLKQPMKALEAFNLMGEAANIKKNLINEINSTLVDLGYNSNMSLEEKTQIVNLAAAKIKEKHKSLFDKFNI